MTEPMTIDAVLADIAENDTQAMSADPAVVAACDAFAERFKVELQGARLALLEIAAALVEASGEQEGPVWDAAMRAAASELLTGAAFVVRALKRKRGEPFSLARFAVVAHIHAQGIAAADWDSPAAEGEGETA